MTSSKLTDDPHTICRACTTNLLKKEKGILRIDFEHFIQYIL